MEPAEPAADAEAPEPVEGQGRGVIEQRASGQRTKKRRPDAPAEKPKPSKRGLNLSDAVWERLQLEALNRKTTASAVAEEILGTNLPRLWIGGRKDS
jgi:hypothetical protein